MAEIKDNENVTFKYDSAPNDDQLTHCITINVVERVWTYHIKVPGAPICLNFTQQLSELFINFPFVESQHCLRKAFISVPTIHQHAVIAGHCLVVKQIFGITYLD